MDAVSFVVLPVGGAACPKPDAVAATSVIRKRRFCRRIFMHSLSYASMPPLQFREEVAHTRAHVFVGNSNIVPGY